MLPKRLPNQFLQIIITGCLYHSLSSNPIKRIKDTTTVNEKLKGVYRNPDFG